MSDSPHSRPLRETEPDLPDADENALQGLLTRAHRPPRMRPAARAALLVQLKRQHERRTKVVALAPRRSGRLAAWVAVMAAAALLVFWMRATTQPVMHENASHVPRIVGLADGSSMVLDAGARVLQRRARELELVRGRVLFDVAPASSLLVLSDGGRVAGQGTRFVLSQEAGATVAAVARGRLRAFSDAGEARLAAGDQAVMRAGKAPEREPARRLTYLTSWARETLAAEQPSESQPIRRGNLKARIPDSAVEWPLPLRKLVVDVVVQDGVVRTTLDHTFFNPQNRDLEGVYQFSLPSDAAVSRLAMYVDGVLMEGGIVERNRGRNIYEDIVYRRRDPALLEWMSGNELKVRIFPLPARTEKRILMSYTQVLERLYDTRRLVVPIPDIDGPVGQVTFHVRVADGAGDLVTSTSHSISVVDDGPDRIATFEAKDHVIGRDLVLALRADKPERTMVRSYVDDAGQYLLARVQPKLDAARPSREPQDWVVLFDTSASRNPAAIRAQERMLVGLLGALDTYDRFTVVAFDVTQRTMSGGFRQVGDFDIGEVEAFMTMETGDQIGMTDLGAAFEHASELFENRSDARARSNILYIGDGVATAGKREASELHDLLAGHVFVGVGVGDAADDAALRDLAEATGGAFTRVSTSEDISWTAFDLVSALNTPHLSNITARVFDVDDNAIDAAVHVSAQASQGEDVSVVARLSKSAPAASIVVSGMTAGKAWSQRIAVTSSAPTAPGKRANYLPRLWARRHIDALVREDRQAHAETITKLGLANFLVTPFTSLLVLETEADYQKHKVVRPAADRWARYEAPVKIDVVREPLGEAAIPWGAVVLRRRGSGTGRGFGVGFGGGGVELSGPIFNKTRLLVDVPMGGWRGDVGGRFAQNRGAQFVRRLAADRQSGGKWSQRTENGFDGWNRPTSVSAIGKRTGKKGEAFGYYVGGLFRAAYDTGVVVDEAMAFGWSGPWQGLHRADFRDLTNLVPQLFADSIDTERERARRAKAEGKVGVVSPAARALLDATARQPARFRFANGNEISVTDEGFVVERTTETGLPEVLSFDGTRLRGSYAELLLMTDRNATGAVMATLGQNAPFMAPSSSELAESYDVSVVESRTLRIAPIGGGALTTITLDDDGRVVRWERAGVVITFRWQAQTLTVAVQGAQPIVLERLAVTPAGGDWRVLPKRDDSWTTIVLPLRERASAEKAVQFTKVGTPPWRAAVGQLLATEAATGRAAWKHIRAIVATGSSPTRGELVLASGGTTTAALQVLEKLADDPVAAYLRDMLRWRLGAGPDAFKPATTSRTFFGSLRAFRRLVGTHSDYEKLRALYGELSPIAASPQLRMAALLHLAQYARVENVDDVVSALDALAASEPSMRLQAQLSAAHRLLSQGRSADAATRFEVAIAEAEGHHIYLDATRLRQARAFKPEGQKLFRRWMLARRDRLIAVGNTAAIVAAATMVDHWGTPDDLAVVMNMVGRIEVDDAGAAYQLASILHRRGFIADATRLVRGYTEEGPLAHAMLLLSAQIAESDSRPADAAALVREAMDRRETMPLGELRRLYRRRFELQVANALALSLPHIEPALAVAAAWRREDPDNAAIDKLCFEALTARGDHQGAFRHLSSIIERHPGEGAAYADVAEALARQGRTLEAERTIGRAIETEPTNPTWLLRQAEIFNQLARPEAARGVLQRIVDGKWQDRFSGQIADAKRRLLQ